MAWPGVGTGLFSFEPPRPSAGTTLSLNTIDVAEIGAGVPGVPGSALLIRGDNLGGGPVGAFTRVTANTFRTPAGSGSVSGLVPGVFIAGATGLAESFGVDDTTVDAAGKVGISKFLGRHPPARQR